MKNLLLFLPATVAASAPPRRIGSTCAAGGSLVTRPVSIGVTSGRLRDLRTIDGAVSSSSLLSSTILTSRRRLGAWLVEPWPIKGSTVVPAGIASVGDGSKALASSPPPCLPWSALDGSGPRHCWCIGDTEQHCLSAGPPQQDGPYRVPAIHTPSTGQYLLSAIQQ